MKKYNTEAIQNLAMDFLSSDVDELKKKMGQLSDPDRKQVGRLVAQSLNTDDTVYEAVSRIKSLPKPVLQGFLLEGLSQNRDWLNYLTDMTAITEILRPLLMDAASENIRDEHWWTNWKKITEKMATEKSSGSKTWVPDIVRFLREASSIPVDMSDIISRLSPLESSSSKSSMSGKKPKKPQKGERLRADKDAIVSTVEKFYRKVIEEQQGWEKERNDLVDQIARLHRERDDLEKRLSDLTQQLNAAIEEGDELRRQREQLREEIATYSAQGRLLQNELQVMTDERDKLKSEIVLWERTAEAQRHQAEQAREETALESRHRLHKNLGPLAGFVRDRAEPALHTFLPQDVRLLAAQFDQLHQEILKEAKLPQEGRISSELLMPPEENVHE